MSAEEKKFCGPCQKLHENKLAESWCPECREFLCQNCTKYHGILETLKDHVIITIENYHKIPVELLVSDSCTEHNLKLEFFCKTHETPCCFSCVRKHHASCSEEDIKKFDNAVKGIKSSAKFEIIKTALTQISKDIEQLLSFSFENIKHLDVQTNFCLTELRETRKKIDEHFDQLEKDLLKQIQTRQNDSKSKITKLISELESKQISTSELSEDLKNLNAFFTNIQTYFGLNVIEKKLKDEETFLKTLIDSKSLSKPNIYIDFSSINFLLQTTKKIGELVVEEIPFNERLSVVKEDQAQLLVNKPKGIHDFKFRLKNKVNLKLKIKGSLDACVIKPSGDLVLLSYDNKQLFTCVGDGSRLMTIATFEKEPLNLDFDPVTNIAVVGCNGAAASYVVDLATKKVNTRDDGCHGVSINKGKLFGTKGKKITCSTLNQPYKIVSEIAISNAYLLSVTYNAIFCTTGRSSNEVICYDHKGQEQWSFKHKDFKFPVGISSSPDGFSFVACQNSNNIWLISPDGTDGRIVADQSDGVNKPRGVNFNSNRKELVYTNEYPAELSVYDVEW